MRVVRIISRLNIGGPAIQAITLTRELAALGYETTLLRGREDPDEGSMDDLAARLGVEPVLVPSLRRDVGWRDLPALASIARHLRRGRPDLVHTHAAKAGTLGRAAALLAYPRRRRRPVLVHTFHGHSLTGYFSARRNRLFRRVERFLARRTDRLIAVSEEVRDELVALGVAPAERFEVIRVGFDLSGFGVRGEARHERRRTLRRALGIAEDERVVTTVARLVPIKRVDRFLEMAARVGGDGTRFLVVGDGAERDRLRASEAARRLGDAVVWTGFRRDMADVYFASDVVVQTSDNEGTPVALIEAQAAGVPVVSTRVGGVTAVVDDTGRVVDVQDVDGLAAAVRELLERTGGPRPGREAAERFSLETLVAGIDRCYRELAAQGVAHASTRQSR